MKILTFNIWKNEGDFPERLNIIRLELQAMDADIICLQEVYRDSLLDALEVIVPKELQTKFYAPARAKIRAGKMSYSGLAILSKYSTIYHDMFDLPTSDNDGGRVALMADIATPYGILRILNLHLSHLSGAEGDALRKAQMNFGLERALKNWSDEALICGDFNERMPAPFFEGFDNQMSGQIMGDQSSLRNSPNALIDHIVLLNCSRLHLSHCEVGFDKIVGMSDHFGVLGYVQTR
ncbi:MAG: hypothetical protein FD163_2356 [Hyphomonadaceae bacterium]|nr:MAG: hypothetical protein FD128_2152 [Hyphomonadaceae bacterium]KAF0183636.1 MAG: hypothetical protein FD163_2356 [Hyphomonadaceae bacterium]